MTGELPDPSARRILFAGGGTGGHLYPGLAIARALGRLAPAWAPFFIGARRGIEREVLPEAGFPYALLDLHPLYRRTPWNNWRTLAGGWTAWRTLSALAREARPRAVVGTGGYAAGVALAWARAHGIPTLLHEPDSHPGLTTRLFTPGASAVFLGFPEAAGRLRPGRATRVLPLGCPIEVPLPRDRAAARAGWQLSPELFTVLVFGGSQGARAINEAVAAWIDRGLPEGIALIWATGRQQAAPFLRYESERVRVRPYLSPITDAYAAADLAITRAGAMSIAELCAWQIPSILVPLPTAAQDHQTHNARTTADSGAAMHLPQASLAPDPLELLVLSLRDDPQRRTAMQRAAAARARPQAAEEIARTILTLLDA